MSGGIDYVMSFIRGVPIICFLIACEAIKADDIKQCLIFSGQMESELAIDLEKFNRISFGPESMTLTNSNDPATSAEVLYSVYNRLKVDYSNPSVGIEEVEECQFDIMYLKSIQSLSVTTECPEPVKVGVFNLSGILVLNSQLYNGEVLSVESLSSGAYVAIAVDKSGSKSIKFVK